jgi:hypothetical protein
MEYFDQLNDRQLLKGLLTGSRSNWDYLGEAKIIGIT